MDEYHQMRDHDQMYRMFMQTEQNAIHTDPQEVFTKLKMSDSQIADLFIEMLEGPANAFTARCDDLLADLTEKYVHHLIDVELGVD